MMAFVGIRGQVPVRNHAQALVDVLDAAVDSVAWRS
jgi:hypothetical protein